MIRVLHFAGTINRFDFIDSVLTQLDRDKFEVSLLTVTASQNRSGAYPDEEKYYSFCLNKKLRLMDPSIWFALAREIRRFRPHILQAHHYDEALIGGILARLLGVPAVVVGHHYGDVIYLLTKGIKRKITLLVEKLANRLADTIVVPTREITELLIRQGEKPGKVISIPYGTDFRMFASLNTDRHQVLGELAAHLVGFSCGRLNAEKGLQHLIRAIPAVILKYPSFRVIIAGTGPEGDNLERLTKDLDLTEIVKFVGWRKDTLDLMASADMVIQPSLSESFGQVLTESLAVGTPVIVTPVGIAPEVVRDGERGGYLVPKGSTAPITDAICTLLDDPEKARMIAAKGNQYVRENLTVQRAARRYEKLYEDLVQRIPLLSVENDVRSNRP